MILAFIIISTSVYALPDTVEFIFISPAKKSALIDLLNFKTKTFQAVAENDDCIPMGDGCFDPQTGYVEGKSGKDYIEQEYGVPSGKPKVENTIDSDMIRCTGAYFDIFCGKAKKVKKKKTTKYEVWVDTSASLRNSDWSKTGDTCYRKSFVTRLSYGCPITIKSFDSSIREIKNDNYLCQTKGGNNTQKIIRWVKNSDTKHLFVLTDIDEAKGELMDFLSNIKAKIHGVGTKPFYPDDLLKLADTLKASCK